jgi:hypothetical protein
MEVASDCECTERLHIDRRHLSYVSGAELSLPVTEQRVMNDASSLLTDFPADQGLIVTIAQVNERSKESDFVRLLFPHFEFDLPA